MITMTRGDTLPLKFTRLDPSSHTIMDAPNAMFFTVKRSWDDKTPVIQKSLADMTEDDGGTWHFVIDANDTENLSYGTYVFDIEVTVSGCVTTICKDELKITREATWSSNRS